MQPFANISSFHHSRQMIHKFINKHINQICIDWLYVQTLGIKDKGDRTSDNLCALSVLRTVISSGTPSIFKATFTESFQSFKSSFKMKDPQDGHYSLTNYCKKEDVCLFHYTFLLTLLNRRKCPNIMATRTCGGASAC